MMPMNFFNGVATAAWPAKLVLILGSLRCEAQAITGCFAADQGARAASSLSTDQIYRIEWSSQVEYKPTSGKSLLKLKNRASMVYFAPDLTF
jgi:hypothetical protein